MGKNSLRNIPTIIVVFGATGDLMAKKIAPSLFNIFKNNVLPSMFHVVGFARREMKQKDFQNHIAEILKKRHDSGRNTETIKKFLNFYSYERGFYDNKSDYFNLKKTLSEIDSKWGMCSNKIFYLAVPPQLFPEILKNLAATGLSKPCGGPDEGWTRVIVEKPFGDDEKTSKSLDALLNKLFKEEQIYRIDHYLAKEMLQNILTFRFSNNLFEANWGNKLIERINIRLLETIGAEDRGGFYDNVGALRDVGQNHLLQMFALVTMEPPKTMKADDIRFERARVLRGLKIPSKDEIKKYTFRAQYNGYRTIKGVASDSTTETYFKIRGELATSRWEGVEIFMESGKRLGKPLKEIEIIFRHPESCLCPEISPGKHYKNSLIIHLEPKEGISINFWSKKPGHKNELEERTFDFNLQKEITRSQYTKEYEKLLLDCIADDQTLFVSSEEIRAMWRFTDPIINGWKKGLVPLNRYEPDSADISKKADSDLIAKTMNSSNSKKEIAVIGLGKMGAGIAHRLDGKGWKVFAFDKQLKIAESLASDNIQPFYEIKEVVNLRAPRIIWLMIPAFAKASAGKPALSPVDEIIFGKNGLAQYLKKGDIIIDGGNSFYEDSITRAKKLKKSGINFVDVGFSGGPSGALNGASIMAGGDKLSFDYLKPLFSDLAVQGGYGYMGKSGAGHFVKMIHNGIEYGMMQSLAEGFALIKKSGYEVKLEEAARVYANGSVIASRLVDWLKNGFEEYGDNLKGISGSVGRTGEGDWTVKTAKKLKVPIPIIKGAVDFRVKSAKKPNYIGQILSMLRNQFGGHSVKKGS